MAQQGIRDRRDPVSWLRHRRQTDDLQHRRRRTAQTPPLRGPGAPRSRYHSDLGVIGRRVTVNGLSRVVVGVMPPGFQFATNQQLWVPLASVASKESRGNRSLLVLGRLKPGVTTARAVEEDRRIVTR